MLKKVYIHKNIDDLIFEIRQDFGEVENIDVSDRRQEDLVKVHLPDLFKTNKIKAIVNLQEIDKDFLISLVENIKVDCVWGFTSLAKNTKLFKLLSTKVTVENVGDLSKKSDKIKFIKSLFYEYEIPNKYLNAILINLNDSKVTIYNEILKLRSLLDLGLGEDSIINSITSYDGNLDVMNFIDSLLNNRSEDTYKYSSKLVGLSSNLIHAVLHKRLLSLIYLSKDNEEEALKCWKYFGYFLQDAKALAKSLGFAKLSKLSIKVDSIFQNYNTDLTYKLSKLMMEYERLQ